MINSTSSSTIAVPSRAGNLTRAWLACADDSQSADKLDKFATELDGVLRQRIPSGTFRGFLRGREDEIRQDAAILLIEGYLLGNRRLMRATRAGNVSEVANQLSRSVSAAISVSIRRLRRQAARHVARFQPLQEHNGGTCCHPSSLGYWSLPLPVQRSLALQALHLAVTGSLITRQQASVAENIVAGKSPTAIAREYGVSRSAIAQRLQPVRRYLSDVVANLEFPLV